MKLKTNKHMAKNVLSYYYGMDYTRYSYKDILRQMKQKDDVLIKRWVESGQTDFTIYQDRDYIADVYICWDMISKTSIKEVVKWMLKGFADPCKLSIFDDYNGLGLTTMYLLQRGFSPAFFNDCESQQDILKWLCKSYNVLMPRNDTDRSGKYDLVMSFDDLR